MSKSYVVLNGFFFFLFVVVSSRFFKLSVEMHFYVDAGLGDKLRSLLRQLGSLHVVNAIAELHER